MEEESATYIQGLQAVPAEGVLAVLAHHLGAALVPLNINFALGAALDGRVVLLVLVKRAAGWERVRESSQPTRRRSNSVPGSVC